MWPIRAALHLPLDVSLAAMKDVVPPSLEVFAPLRKSLGGDRVAIFFEIYSGQRTLFAPRGLANPSPRER